MRQIERDELEPLAIGAWILGTGGGGSPYLSDLNMRTLCTESTRICLMGPAEPDDDALVAAVSIMGAPLVGRNDCPIPPLPPIA